MNPSANKDLHYERHFIRLLIYYTTKKIVNVCALIYTAVQIDQFRHIEIQPKTIDLSTRLWGITTEFVGFIPQSLVLRSIVLG